MDERDAGPAGDGERSRRDLTLIVGVQALRAFLYGLGSVLIGTELAAGGFSDAKVGLVFTAMLAGMALSSIGVGLFGDRFGRRRLYAGFLLVMGATGAVFALTRWLPALLIAALTGTLSTDPNESGPITSLEQAMIGEAPAATRLRVFGRYNAVAYMTGALGSLAAGGPELLRRAVPSLPANQRFLLLFPLFAVACAALAARLSGRVEPPAIAAEGPAASGPIARAIRRPLRSRRIVTRLAGLFALDSFGGGFVVQSFMVFWFERKFGTSTGVMGLVFFGAGLLQAASSVAAAWLGARIGLLNTMVFTHLPSNLLLAAIPFAPNLTVAVVLLLCRFALSQMDVPTRQAYVVAMVDADERTAAAAYTNMARYASRPAGPVAAGALMQHVALSAPFVAAGAIKVVYDAALFGLFRRAPLPERERDSTRGVTRPG